MSEKSGVARVVDGHAVHLHDLPAARPREPLALDLEDVRTASVTSPDAADPIPPPV
jgi:hypothetical protein